jgi:hypothetical protein
MLMWGGMFPQRGKSLGFPPGDGDANCRNVSRPITAAKPHHCYRSDPLAHPSGGESGYDSRGAVIGDGQA